MVLVVYLVDENKTLGGGIDNNGSTQLPVGGPGSVTTSMLSDTILKYLKPEITLQPSFAGTVRNGTNVELSPGVEGKYVTYQWYKDGAPIDGATSQLFTVESFDAGTHDGNYSLLVSNDFGGGGDYGCRAGRTAI